VPALLECIQRSQVDPSSAISDRGKLEDGPELHSTFREKKDGWIRSSSISDGMQIPTRYASPTGEQYHEFFSPPRY
jgi:hypothetical protein